MLCPKCGQEYEGDKCPRCSGPQIIVNNSDYLRRKKAYEEKQAGKKSASSDNVANDVFKAMSGNMSKASQDKKVSDNSSQPDIENISYNKSSEDTINDTTRSSKQNDDTPDAIDIMKQKGIDAIHNGIKHLSAKAAGKGRASGISKKLGKSSINESDNSNEDIVKNADIRKRNISHTINRLGKIDRKRLKRTIIGLAALLVIVIAGTCIYRLAIRKNYDMYMSSERGIYNVSNLESEYVCDSADAIFATDKKTFYTPQLPNDIDKDKITSTLASDNGKYFAAAAYDEDSSKYSLYIFNKDGCIKIADNNKVKSIKYITDSGKLIYTDYLEVKSSESESSTDSNNVAGGISDINLYEYVIDTKADGLKGTQQLIDDNIHTVNIYTQKNILICLDNDSSLYLYNYEKMNKKTGIADEVSYVFAMSDETQNLYTYHTDEVNQLKSAAGFIYSINNVCYYHEITDKEVTNKTVDEADTQDYVLAKTAGSNMQFIYEKDNYCYIINAGKISYAKTNGKIMGDYNQIAQTGAMTSFVYIPSQEQLVFIDSDNRLSYAKKGSVKAVINDVNDGSLSLVVNTDEGLSYTKDTDKYYISSVSSKEIKLCSEVTASANRVVFYKNKLYFYKEDGILYTCSHKGKELNEIGTVEWFWLGIL